jgi:hypothetical protein
MVSHPVEANFYVHVSDAEVEVTFAPTRSLPRPLRRSFSDRAPKLSLSALATMISSPVIAHPCFLADLRLNN